MRAAAALCVALVAACAAGCRPVLSPSDANLETRDPVRGSPPSGVPVGEPVPPITTLHTAVQRYSGPDAGEPGLEEDSVEQVRVDGEGNVLLALRVRQPVNGATFDDEEDGTPRWVVAKLDPAGAFQWGRAYAASRYRFRDLAVSPLGNVYLSLELLEEPDGAVVPPGILLKLGPDGAERWRRTLEDGAWGGPLTVDRDGNVLVVDVRAGAAPVSNHLLAYDWEGVLRWSRRLGPYGGDVHLVVRQAAFAPDGSFAATATLFGRLELAGTTVGVEGEATPLVLHSTRDGDVTWVRGGLGSFVPTEVAVGEDGAIAVTGVLASGTGRWGAAERVNTQAAPAEHAFLGWLDAEGEFGPVRILGNEPGRRYVPHVTMHAAGNALVAQARELPSGEAPPEGRCRESDVWSISPADALRWHRFVGDTDCGSGARSVEVRGVAGSPRGDTFLVGQYRGDVDLGTGVLPSVGADGFWLRWWRE